MGALRPSRQPLRGFLRMRSFFNIINRLPNAEERRQAHLEARTIMLQQDACA
jgi:hypothetical protein